MVYLDYDPSEEYEVSGTCDTCGKVYDALERNVTESPYIRCGDCGNCNNCCPHRPSAEI